MSDIALTEFVGATAAKFGIPGVAVGIYAGGEAVFACHGVTSVENPLPVDEDTVFALGSVSKTFTATAVLCLAARGKVELDAPVRRYVPELVLADERVAARITVRQLLNHTSGLGNGEVVESGSGDDALARYVATLATLDLIGEPGERASYSQAGYNVLGRMIEHVTGLTFEKAIATMLFEPLELEHSLYSADELLTRRFAVGHNRAEDGTMSVARLRKRARGDNAGGGLESSVSDLLRWSRFHLGDIDAQVVPAELLREMRDPTVALRASTLGDDIGLCWFLRDVDGVRTVGHGGSTNGQFTELLTVPERDFAVVSLANAGPDGIQFNQAVVRWALEHYLGVIDRDPEPLPFDAARAREIVGLYDLGSMRLIIESSGAELRLDVDIKPEIRAAADQELPPGHTGGVGLLPRDEYIITSGGMQGQRGYFTRDASGAVIGIDIAGRLANRVAAQG
ncbi:serine hydrolase domain-containing protein [Nocardia arthritidis]|nr:serine hydrolase domain-containing protein [Nocardia arthritidis]